LESLKIHFIVSVRSLQALAVKLCLRKHDTILSASSSFVSKDTLFSKLQSFENSLSDSGSVKSDEQVSEYSESSVSDIE